MDIETDCDYKQTYVFNPKYPSMMFCSNREATYSNWSTQLAQKPTELSRNGFFYTDIGDKVTCFYCGISLRQWDKSDDIVTEHLKWSSHCLYAKIASSNKT